MAPIETSHSPRRFPQANGDEQQTNLHCSFRKGDPMVTQAFPISSPERNQNHLHELWNARSGAVEVASIHEMNTIRSDKGAATDESAFNGIIGSSPALKFVLTEVKRVAEADTSVLVLGETGTGKELIARPIHNLSTRPGCPFVKG